MFQVRQGRHSRGDDRPRPARRAASPAAARATRRRLRARPRGRRPAARVVRRLWGKDRHARFRTHGRDSVATVRGTEWVTTDRCDGTLTKVAHGRGARARPAPQAQRPADRGARLPRAPPPALGRWSGAGTGWRSSRRRSPPSPSRSSPRTSTCSTASRTRPSRCASTPAAPRRPNDVAVVAIDDVTFSDLEVQWPFKRSLHARAIDALRRAGAKRDRLRRPVHRADHRARGPGAVPRRPPRRRGRARHHGDRRPRRHERARRRGEPRALAGAHAAAANLETDRGGVIHRFPYSSGGLRSVAVVAAGLDRARRSPRRRSTADGAWIDYAGPRGTVPTVSFSDLVSGRADPSACAAASSSSARPPPRCRTSTRPRRPTTS